MPFSPLDALMQGAAPSRKVDPPLRNDKPSAFAPTLEQAYHAEAPRTPQSAPAPPSKPKAEESSAQGKEEQSDRPTDDAVAAENGDGAIVAIENEQDAESQPDEQDAVEISAEAAAAAGAAQNAKSVEEVTVVVVKESDDSAEAVEQIDAEGSADAKRQAEAAAAAAQLEGEVEAAASEEQATAEEAKEPVVSTLHSTRHRSKQNEGDGKGDAKAAAGSKGVETGKHPDVVVAEQIQSVEETAEAKPVEEPVAATLEKSDADSREPSRSDLAEPKGDSKPANSNVDTKAVADAIPVADAANRVEAASSDAATSPPVAVGVETTTPGNEASPRTAAALDRLLASHSLKGSKETSDPSGTPTIDRARFVQRVEGAMKAAHQRDGKIQVRLSPPDLGSVKIELAVQNGVLSAKLEAETPAARNLLLDSLPALRERLAQQDIRIEKFDVDVRDQGGNAGGGPADQRTADQSADRQNGRPRSGQARTTVPAPVPAPRGIAAASTASGLDIRV